VRLYQVTCITLNLVLFKGGWYILILPVGTRFFDVPRIGIFRRSSLLWRCRRSIAQNAFEADSGNWSRCTRACRTSWYAYQEGLSDRACFSRTGASPPAAAAGCTVCLAAAYAAAGTGAYMTCMVRTVLTIHVRQAQVHLPTLPLSATKSSLAKILLHRGVDPILWNCVGSRSYDLKKNLDKTTEAELIFYPPLLSRDERLEFLKSLVSLSYLASLISNILFLMAHECLISLVSYFWSLISYLLSLVFLIPHEFLLSNVS